MSNIYHINAGNPYQYPFDEEKSLNDIDEQMAYLQNLKSQIKNNKTKPKEKKHSIWDDIQKEVQSLNKDEQKELLENENYIILDQQVQGLINQAIFEMVKPIVEDSEIGKEILNKQLNFIRSIKEQIITQTNKKSEILKQFQIASQQNPDLTYKEFIKSLNE